ncbi:MAG TPA: helix-turn-helix domain-containing protein [Planctomycetota bacterium]|nr:helix-turn-helix domain-containing protein [Planctomycetota bacterium]
MPTAHPDPPIPVPKNWPDRVRSAMLHVFSLARLACGAARGWSLEQTARAFLLTAATVASWVRRMDEGGPNALARLAEPVNKFPDFVRYIVQRLRASCPMLGKVKTAEILARAGASITLHRHALRPRLTATECSIHRCVAHSGPPSNSLVQYTPT